MPAREISINVVAHEEIPLELGGNGDPNTVSVYANTVSLSKVKNAPNLNKGHKTRECTTRNARQAQEGFSKSKVIKNDLSSDDSD